VSMKHTFATMTASLLLTTCAAARTPQHKPAAKSNAAGTFLRHLHRDKRNSHALRPPRTGADSSRGERSPGLPPPKPRSENAKTLMDV
jgi:hypothetical protein